MFDSGTKTSSAVSIAKFEVSKLNWKLTGSLEPVEQSHFIFDGNPETAFTLNNPPVDLFLIWQKHYKLPDLLIYPKLGDPLQKLSNFINWDIFRAPLDKAFSDTGQPFYADSAYTGEEQNKIYEKKKV